VIEVTPVGEYWGQLLSSGETIYAGLIYRVPPRLWRNLSKAQNELKALDPRQLYTNACNFHVSIKGLGYLGEQIDRSRYESTLSKIQKIISEIEPFEFSIRGLGIFPTGIHARVDDNDKFREINDKIAKGLRGEVDQSKYDSEAFVPHITLATFNTKDVSKLIERAESSESKAIDFGTAGVFEVELVRTNLILALGPEETQDRAYSYIRSFWLGKFSR
jgi:2'-5' RNA ligase